MRKGFTLIEVLVVAVIVAILAAVAIPAYNAYIASTKVDVAKNLAAVVVQSAASYYQKFPTAAMAFSKTGYDAATMTFGAGGEYDIQIPQGYTVGDISGGTVRVQYMPDSSGAESLVGDGTTSGGIEMDWK